MSEGAPPTYDSIFGRLKEAKATSDGNVGFAKKSYNIIFGSLACTIICGLLLALPVTCIVIGAIHLHCCPAERYIPIYLIVSGCFTIVKYVASLIQKCTSGDQEEQSGNVGLACLDGILGCFLFAWFICGNVWIYRTYGHFSTDSDQPNFCHPTLFYFSFWLLNATYIICGLAAFLGCCVAITAACCTTTTWQGKKEEIDIEKLAQQYNAYNQM